MAEKSFGIKIKNIFAGVLTIAVLTFFLIHNVGALVVYPPGALLQPGDVTSSHIRNGTILDVDIATSSRIHLFKIGQGSNGAIPWFSGDNLNATTTELVWDTINKFLGVATATPQAGLAVQGTGLFSGSVSVAGLTATGTTRFNNVSYTWPSADGSNSQALTTNGAGTLAWSAPTAGSVRNSFTAGMDLGAGEAVIMARTTTATSSLTHLNSDNEAILGETTGNVKYAQSFTATSDMLIYQIQVYIRKAGTPTDNMQFSIQGGYADRPSGNIIASTTIAGGSLTTTLATTTLSFSPFVFIKGGANYWLVAERTGALDNVNRYVWALAVLNNSYTGGLAVRNSGSAWVDDVDRDLEFSIDSKDTTAGQIFRNFDITSPMASSTLGFTAASVSRAGSASIVSNGLLNAFSGLEAGSLYYLSATNTYPVINRGSSTLPVGVAVSGTNLLIDIDKK